MGDGQTRSHLGGHGFVQLEGENKSAFTFAWYSYENPQNARRQSIDIVFYYKDGAGTWPSNSSEIRMLFWEQGMICKCGKEDFRSLAAFQFLVDCLQRVRQASAKTRVAKLIVPLVKGQIVRSDIMAIRFGDCELAESAVCLAQPLQEYSGQPLSNGQLCDLREMFVSAAAGLLLHDSTAFSPLGLNDRGLSFRVEMELEDRLSFPWIIEKPATNMTLVMVDGNEHPSHGHAVEKIYLSAKALGISLLVLDNSGHWLEGSEFQDWREQFLPTKLVQPPDKGMTDRIVASIKQYGGRIDGIVTFRDSYKRCVAEVAQQLFLPTSKAEAYEIATDKHKLSVFEGREAYRIRSEADAARASSQIHSLWPVMLKPCSGSSSNACFRVGDAAELQQVYRKLQSAESPFHGAEFVIEPFCYGPEVIANFVLLDGEILFSEFMDTFPKTAELDPPETERTKTFVEQDMVVPTALPSTEIDTLRTSFLSSLLRLGIRNGILHLEGRVSHSTMGYNVEDGILDLHPLHSVSAVPPSPWLIEINPRPPASTVSEMTQLTYGIDYWGLALVLALDDKQRAQALSQAYHNGPRYTTVMVVIQAEYDKFSCEGIFDSDDICLDLLSRRPDLAKHISRCGCFIKRGQRVPHPSSGRNRWLAYFDVFSRKGRSAALQVAKEVREEVRFSFR